jgi:hypothetical protein
VLPQQPSPEKQKAAAFATAFQIPVASPAYFFLAGAAVAVFKPAVASTFGFSFFGFLASLFDFN